MIQRSVRSPYLTDSRVQTFYFLRKMGDTGEIFSLEDLTTIPNGYQLSSILYYLPRWKDVLLTLYHPEDGRTFFEGKRLDRQFYTCRPLSLWDDWGPFMRSCFWERQPILPPRPEPETERPILIAGPPPPVPLPDDFFRLTGFVFCILALLLSHTLMHAIRKQWSALAWSYSHVIRLLLRDQRSPLSLFRILR